MPKWLIDQDVLRLRREARIFGYGAILVPVADQKLDPDALYALIAEASNLAELENSCCNQWIQFKWYRFR